MSEGLSSRRVVWLSTISICSRWCWPHTALDKHYHYLVLEPFHHPSGNPVPCTIPSSQLLATTSLLPVSTDLFLLDIYINKIAQYVAFRVFFHGHISKAHAVAWIRASYCWWLNNIVLYKCTTGSWTIHLLRDNLGHFHLLDTVKWCYAYLCTGSCLNSWCQLGGQIPRSGIAITL